MKKIIYGVGLISLLNVGTIAYGETATGTSASSAETTAQSSTGNSTSQSSSNSASSSSQNTSSSDGTNSTSQSQTQTSTTAQNQTDTNGQNQNQTPPVAESRDNSTDKNSGSQKETKNSTTIINETVNNNAKGNNILLMTLTSLSASVTIIGGIIALVRHLRGLGKKKNSVSKTKAPKNGSALSSSLTDLSVNSDKTQNHENPLIETQQINLQADELLKNHKKQQKEYRRSRR